MLFFVDFVLVVVVVDVDVVVVVVVFVVWFLCYALSVRITLAVPTLCIGYGAKCGAVSARGRQAARCLKNTAIVRWLTLASAG